MFRRKATEERDEQSGEQSARPNRRERRAEKAAKAPAKAPGTRTLKTKVALKAVVGNVTLTANEVTAWYVLEPHSVSFKPDAEVEDFIRAGAANLASLTGYRTYWRVTARPYAVTEMARDTWEDAQQNTKSVLPGARDMLVREQERLRGNDLNVKYTYLGVRIATKRRYPSDPRREVMALRETITKVSSAVAKEGLEGTPADAEDMDLLLRRSIGLGLPAPRMGAHLVGDVEEPDVATFTTDVDVTAEPWARTVRVQGFKDRDSGEPIERRVAVLTMGRIGDMRVPQDGKGGWMHRTDRLPFPVEWMATADIMPDEKIAKATRHQLDVVQDQYQHYVGEHHKPAPEALKRQHSLAIQVEDELNRGMGGTATRTEGWYRIAVWGRDERDVQDRVSRVEALYGRQVEWWWSKGQYNLVREYIPGEPLANEAAKRRLPVTSLLAALPAATAAIGDPFGITLGQTAGTSRRPVIWHPFMDMERRHRSGLMMLTGGLGSGKSVALGLIVYRAVMLGSRWTVFDPSGRLAKLCDLPELRDYSEHVDLMAGRAGELSPYFVIEDPRPEHFNDPEKSDLQNQTEYAQEVEEVRARRQTLCLDTLLSLMPREWRQDRKITSVMGAATARVPAERLASPNRVLDHLAAIANASYELPGATSEEAKQWEHEDAKFPDDYRIAARDAWRTLELFSRTPKGRLIFGQLPPEAAENRRHVALRVYSMHGLKIPTEKEISEGSVSSEARQSMALFNLAAWLTQQSIYHGNHDERKGLAIDEAHMLAFAEGQALMDKSSVDSRKHNARVILCSQNVNHFDTEALAPLVGAVLVGRTTAEQAARDALTLCGLKQSDGYVRLLGGLTRKSRRQDARSMMGDPAQIGEREAPHEFVFSTKDLGMVEKIRIDGWAHPHVMEALNTAARPGRHEDLAESDDDNASQDSGASQNDDSAAATGSTRLDREDAGDHEAA